MNRTTLFTKEHIHSIFKENKSILNKNGSKGKALKQIDELDFPGRKTPGWEKTELYSILRHKYAKPQPVKISEEILRQFIFYGIDADILVFTNGYFDEERSTIKSTEQIYVGSLKRAFVDMPKVAKRYFDTVTDSKASIFSSINKAYAEDGFIIYMPDNAKTKRPVHILNFIDGEVSKPVVQNRNLVVAGKNTKLDIINTYHSVLPDFSLTNIFTEIILEENAEINYHLFQGEGYDAAQINKIVVKQEKNSKFKSNTATMCGTMVRNDIEVDLSDEYCDTKLNGFYLPTHRQITDNSILINHNKPNCTASQFYRGVIEDQGKAIFTGKVFVAPNAQHTDSEQSNQNILLSKNARAYSRPQLEIYADDVQCAHGSTIGQIGEEKLFYLQTRGISKRNAQTLLLYAFVSEVLKHFTIDSYKNYISFLLNKRLKGENLKSLCMTKICPGC